MGKASARWLMVIVVGPVLLLVAADALVRQVSFESFRAALDASLSRRLDTDVDVNGTIHLELLPVPQFEVEDLAVENRRYHSMVQILEIERISFRIEVLPLFRRVFSVDEVDVSGATLHIRPVAEVRTAFASGAGDVDPVETQPSVAEFEIRRLNVERFRINYERANRSTTTVEFGRLEFSAEDSAHPIHVEGVGKYDGREFELVADTGSVNELLASSAPFRLEAKIRSADSELEVELSGTIESPLRLAGINLQFAARDASIVFPDSVVPVSTLGSVSLSGVLRNPAGTLSVDELRIETDSSSPVRLRVDGSISDLFATTGVELEVKASAQDSRIFSEFVNATLPGGPLRAEFRVSDADGSLGLEQVSIHVDRPDRFTLDIQGSIDDVREIDEISLEVDLAVRDLGVIGALFDTELPAIGPIEIRGQARGSDELLALRGQMVVGQSRFDADWEFSFAPGRRRQVTVVLESAHTRLADFGLAPEAERADQSPADEASFFDRWWFGAEELRLDDLRDFDFDLDVQAQRLTGTGAFDLEDVRAHLILDHGELEMRDVSAQYEGGRIDASLRLDARGQMPQWALRLEAYGVDLTRIGKQFQVDTEFAGHLDISTDLTSRGSTRADVVSALDGRFGALLREGNLVSQYGRAFSIDFLRISVPQFLNRQNRETDPSIQCLLAITPITEGVAQIEQLYLVGDGITVAGSGSVDLPRNRLDLRLAPHVHEPGLVSVAVTVDVTGPIESPVFKPLSRSLASSAARSVFENAMRPVRGALQVGLGREPQATDDPCTVAAIGHLREQSLETSGVE